MRKTATAITLVFIFLVASFPFTVKPTSAAVPAENAWMQKTPMHETRSSMGVAVANNRIYVIGGNTDKGIVGMNEAYDSTNDSWAFKQPMPTPRSDFAVAAFEDRIYCIGGYLADGTPTRINEVYDPATDTWETKAPMPTSRVGLKANIANGKIYLIGGYFDKPGDLLLTYNITYASLNEVYNPANDSWATMKPIPTPVSNYVSAVVNNKIYVFGGVANIEVGALNQIYDAETDTWSQGAASPDPIYYGFAAATEGVNAPVRIYILHQELGSPDAPYNGNAVLRVYDTEKARWSSAAAPPTNRAGYGLAILNDLLYAIGGVISGYQTYPDDWIHGPSVIAWYASNEQYVPFGFHVVPPAVSILSIFNQTYSSGNLSLTFTVNKPVAWKGYCLDGGELVSISGNISLNELSNGSHNITVYANDTLGNMGVSENIKFTVAVPEPVAESFPVVPVVATSGAVIVACLGFVVYFKNRKKQV